MTPYEELDARNLVAQSTDPSKVRALLNGSPIKFYVGFDPTADSLHVGHFVQSMVIAHLQRAGHIPVILMGGATAQIGDPTDKTELRQMLSAEEVDRNVRGICKQMSALVDFSDDRALVVNNADWTLNRDYVSFLREVGVHFPVSRMLAAACYKSRLEQGLTFFEMGYMVIQAHDFLHLNRTLGVVLELGGDDQWSNMIGGVELCRRCDGTEVYAQTSHLLLTSDGRKMGKTEKGALWLNPERTSPYEFYQYWRNVADADVINCLKMLTFLSLEEIAELSKLQDSELNRAKEALAFTVTEQIHGTEEAQKAQTAARSFFLEGGAAGSAPTLTLEPTDFLDGAIDISSVLVRANLAKSRGDARRLIDQGSVWIGEEKVSGISVAITQTQLEQASVLLRKGKKEFCQIILASTSEISV